MIWYVPVAVVALGNAEQVTRSVRSTCSPRSLAYCAKEPSVAEHAVPFSWANQ